VNRELNMVWTFGEGAQPNNTVIITHHNDPDGITAIRQAAQNPDTKITSEGLNSIANRLEHLEQTNAELRHKNNWWQTTATELVNHITVLTAELAKHINT
jgi:hypothetical protein